MKEMTMLDLDHIDLSDLCEALEDHSSEQHWYLDRATGEFLVEFDFAETDESLDDRDLIGIEPLPSHESYDDLADFTARVRDPRAHDLLERAIEGRGAFRRFKDTLFEFPELRQAWFGFHDARIRRRALEWLIEEGVVDEARARRTIDELMEPALPELSGRFDAVAIAESIGRRLKEIYGGRLRGVQMFGSWARGDAHPESDIDLLVILDRVDSWLDESRRVDELLWRHSLENSTIVSAVIVSQTEFDRADEPLLIRVAAEGVDVA